MPSPNLLRDCQLAGGLELQVWEPAVGLIRLANHFSPSPLSIWHQVHWPLVPCICCLYSYAHLCLFVRAFARRFQAWSLVLLFASVRKGKTGGWTQFEQLNSLDSDSQIWPNIKIIRVTYSKTHSRNCPDLLNGPIRISGARAWEFSFLTRLWDDSIPRWFGSHCSKRKKQFHVLFLGLKKKSMCKIYKMQFTYAYTK